MSTPSPAFNVDPEITGEVINGDGRQNPDRPLRADWRTEEAEIDQALADSFPASDPPPWTLGVESD